MIVNIKFRPLERETLELLQSNYEANGKDSVAAYSRIISAAMLSAAMLGLDRELVAQQVDVMMEHAIKAVAGRPDIFGTVETDTQ